jgi:hypothetical protein
MALLFNSRYFCQITGYCDFIALKNEFDVEFYVFQDKVGSTWELREVSLIHQKVLVIAEVAWEPRVTRGVYLVTWEVDGGGLKGNLFTDSTCVTLSLWPDTMYHIQVGCRMKYCRVISIKSPSFCIPTFSSSLTNITALLSQSRDCSCYLIRSILAPPPL